MGIYADFIDIQMKMPSLVKDASGAHGFKYSTLNQVLDVILPMCHERGIGLMQVTHPIDGCVGVETVIFNAKNERISSGVLAVPLTTDSDGNIINVGNINKQGNVSGQYGAQAYGSALSYARRYSLTAFFGMKSEDDDGCAASQPRRKVEEKPQQKQKIEPLDMAKFEKAMRGATSFNTLKKFYQNGMNRATEEQAPVVNALFEELKVYFASAEEDKARQEVHEAQMESQHDDWGNRE